MIEYVCPACGRTNYIECEDMGHAFCNYCGVYFRVMLPGDVIPSTVEGLLEMGLGGIGSWDADEVADASRFLRALDRDAWQGWFLAAAESAIYGYYDDATDDIDDTLALMEDETEIEWMQDRFAGILSRSLGEHPDAFRHEGYDLLRISVLFARVLGRSNSSFLYDVALKMPFPDNDLKANEESLFTIWNLLLVALASEPDIRAVHRFSELLCKSISLSSKHAENWSEQSDMVQHFMSYEMLLFDSLRREIDSALADTDDERLDLLTEYWRSNPDQLKLSVDRMMDSLRKHLDTRSRASADKVRSNVRGYVKRFMSGRV